MRYRSAVVFVLVAAAVFSTGCRARPPAPAPTAVAPTHTSTPAPTRVPLPTSTPTPVPIPTSAVSLPSPTPRPVDVRAKIEIVWPHGGAGVQDADQVNVTAFLLAGDGTQAIANQADSVPCDWEPTVQLWGALDNQPVQLLGAGQKRMLTGGGRRFPAWDFNDVDVSAARDPANKMTFFVTAGADGETVRAFHNVWVHAADARTLFPQPDTPSGTVAARPDAVDARIEIVWPHDNLSVEEAQKANITAYLFAAGSDQALSPDISSSGGWTPVVRLHSSVNSEPEAAPGRVWKGRRGSSRLRTESSSWPGTSTTLT